MNAQEVKDYMCSTIYTIIYDRCFKAYDEIIKNFPNMCDDFKNDKWIAHIREREPNISDKELVAHAYAMIVMTYYLMN